MRHNPVLPGWRAGLPPLSWTQYPDAGRWEAAWASSPDLASSESAQFYILEWPAKTRHGDPREGKPFEVRKRGRYGNGTTIGRTDMLAAAKDVARYHQSPEASLYTKLPMDQALRFVRRFFFLPRHAARQVPVAWFSRAEAEEAMQRQTWHPRRFAEPFRVEPVDVEVSKYGTILAVRKRKGLSMFSQRAKGRSVGDA
jgi:hypothetical protein